MNRRKRILLALLSALLLTPAWYSWGSGLFLFVAFIPLLFLEDELNKPGQKGRALFWYPFLTFFTWNVLTTWWVKNASFPGSLAAFTINTLLMTLTFRLFSLTRKKMGDGFGYFSLFFYWLAYEYLYLHGEISWTWLNLGNGFANDIRLIQFYEFTGTLGGSAWILAVNLILFKFIKAGFRKVNFHRQLAGILFSFLLIAGPAVWSLIRYYSYQEEANPYRIAVLQPNIDPYMKFNDIPAEEQMMILLRIADSVVHEETDYLVAPETFINNNLWLEEIEINPAIRQIRDFLEPYPKLKFVIGATTYKSYSTEEEKTETARKIGNVYYDSFNSALQIDSGKTIPVYHKSQLVVGVEKMPYTRYLGFLQRLMLNLGGTFRSHGIQEERDAFASPQDGNRVGPVICYESIFGEYATEYVSKAGANFLFVITNDGWWGDTPGYVQHNSFSSLRAVENRRSIARSANTGISSFINQRGDILKEIGWWQRGGMELVLNANDKLTFYTKHGDYIGRISVFTGLAVLLMLFVRILRKTKSRG